MELIVQTGPFQNARLVYRVFGNSKKSYLRF